MNPPARPRTVGWKVSALAPGTASVRYRALLPAATLELAGVCCRVFRTASESDLDGLDWLVIVKSFTPDDVRLAQAARARGIRVLFDLCDNVFVDGYGGRVSGQSVASTFLLIARLADCVVTTTQPLADVVRQHLPGARVEIIPDGIEGAATDRQMAALLHAAQQGERAKVSRQMRQRVRNALRRVRNEGVQAIPRLVGSLARRVHEAIARRRPHEAHAQRAVAGRAVVPTRGNCMRIVWFGNHGASYARFGMLDILEFRAALETFAREHDAELVVISNNLAKFDEHIRPLAIPTRYVEWNPAAVVQWLDAADVAIVPNTLDPFSVCKSANRTVLALASGVPVVATPTPALEPLAAYVHTGDPLAAFRTIVADGEAARARAREGFLCAEHLFGNAALQARWLELLQDCMQSTGARDAASAPEPFLVIVLHLIQDLDLALPILREAGAAGISCEAWCSASLFGKSPRVLASLDRECFPFRILPEDEKEVRALRFAPGTRALLTIAETNLGPHRIPRTLTEAAQRQGLFTATLQHGFENVALTYEDAVHAIDKVTIAARRVYTWGNAETLHPRIAADLRSRCVAVGCPKDADAPSGALQLPGGKPVVGLFENLHWHRYSDAYRRAFLQNVDVLARSFPEVIFLVKPHHAGAWLSRVPGGDRPSAPNLVVADPESPEWEHHTAGALLPSLAAVITTPSTVALDAARKGLPVAVAAGDLSLDRYAPLPLLTDAQDWRGFVAGALDPVRREALASLSRRFVDRVLVPGNAAARIVADLRMAAAA